MNEPRGKPEPKPELACSPGSDPIPARPGPIDREFSAGGTPDPAPHPTPDPAVVKADKDKKDAQDRVREAQAGAAVKDALGGASPGDTTPRGGASGGMGGANPGGGPQKDPHRPTDGG